MKNKNDVEDVFLDTKVDNNRIFQPISDVKRVKLKNLKDL